MKSANVTNVNSKSGERSRGTCCAPLPNATVLVAPFKRIRTAGNHP